MKKIIVALALVSASLGGARLASAGAKRNLPIQGSIAQRYVYGDLGAIRASGDVNQRVGCEVYHWLGSPAMASCWAYDAAGNYGSCNTSDPNMIAGANAMNSDSGVYISWDANWNCTTINAVIDSSYMPKGL